MTNKRILHSTTAKLGNTANSSTCNINSYGNEIKNHLEKNLTIWLSLFHCKFQWPQQRLL